MDCEKDQSNSSIIIIRSWANLPRNILEIIKSKLYSATLIRFMAVCKKWREEGNKNRSITILPWPAVNFCETRFELENPPQFIMKYKFYDPQEGKIYRTSFEVPESSSYLVYNCDLEHHSIVYASKRGWILVGEESPVGSRTLNLYNPFGRYVFPLPVNFDNFRIDAAAFSANPTSSECVMFVAFRCNSMRSYIGTYRFDDENWSWTAYEISQEPSKMVKSIAYCEDEAMVYYVFQDGTLGRFDYLDKTSLIFYDTSFCYPIESIHLVEYEGDIILASAIVNQDHRTSWHGYHWIVSRFNRDCMSWVSDGLEGRTLFVSEASFCVPAVKTPPAIETAVVGDLGGCVCYFYRDRFWRIYCVKDHWYKFPESFGWKAEDVGEKRFWIEPPYVEEN